MGLSFVTSVAVPSNVLLNSQRDLLLLLL